MKLEFTISENDLLTHQLFATSKSKRVQKRRAKSKLFLLLIYMGVGLFIWDRNGVVIGGIFFLICLPLYFLYVYMERRQYVNHIKAYVQETYKDRAVKNTSLTFGENQINMKDGDHESIVPLSEIEIIHEIGSLYSLGLQNGQFILIPKSNVSPVDNLAPFLHELADRLDVPFQQNLKWKWT